MNRPQRRFGYLIAIVACAVVLAARLALNEALAEQARLLPFIVAVMAAAWWGGFRPGILATALGAFFGILFIVPPSTSLTIETLADGLNAVIFVFIGVTISTLCEALHAAQRREAERQFRTLADSIAQLVWMARPDGNRFWFNQRWYEYTGRTLEQLVGAGWQSVCDPSALPRVLETWQAAVATGEPWEETYPLRRTDGQIRWHLARAEPVRDEHGQVSCWFGTSTDIQDRIETEQALKEADARKDQFLATLAHELRNPLSPISNALLLWPRVAHDKAEMEHLRAVISRQVKQLVRLIDDLMDFSRIARGKGNLRRQAVDVASLIRDAVEAVQPLLVASDHHLTVATPDEPVFVNGDAARLTQVFSNVLNNAAKYTARGGAISVLVEREGDQAVVRIRDNGLGISPPLLSAIFEPFRQVDATLERSQGGLGIGLTLARQFVELHGGTIEARSEGLGQGSEFVVRLPALAKLPAVHAKDGKSQRPLREVASARRRILVVDDRQESAETLASVLRWMGHDASALHEGQAAIEWVLAHHPDIVFLDIAMPGLDGYEVARRLRQHHELRATVLVALTGYGQQEDRRRAFEAGFDFHLTKPTDIAALEDLLLNLSDGLALTAAEIN
jgi:PAS domain S-box-containing protein